MKNIKKALLLIFILSINFQINAQYNLYGIWSRKTAITAANSGVVVSQMLTDSRGNIYICGRFYGTVSMSDNTCVTTNSGGYPYGGQYDGYTDHLGRWRDGTEEKSDGFVTKYDNNGNWVWSVTIKSDIIDNISSMVLSPDENSLIFLGAYGDRFYSSLTTETPEIVYGDNFTEQLEYTRPTATYYNYCMVRVSTSTGEKQFQKYLGYGMSGSSGREKQLRDFSLYSKDNYIYLMETSRPDDSENYHWITRKYDFNGNEINSSSPIRKQLFLDGNALIHQPTRNQSISDFYTVVSIGVGEVEWRTYIAKVNTTTGTNSFISYLTNYASEDNFYQYYKRYGVVDPKVEVNSANTSLFVVGHTLMDFVNKQNNSTVINAGGEDGILMCYDLTTTNGESTNIKWTVNLQAPGDQKVLDCKYDQSSQTLMVVGYIDENEVNFNPLGTPMQRKAVNGKAIFYAVYDAQTGICTKVEIIDSEGSGDEIAQAIELLGTQILFYGTFSGSPFQVDPSGRLTPMRTTHNSTFLAKYSNSVSSIPDPRIDGSYSAANNKKSSYGTAYHDVMSCLKLGDLNIENSETIASTYIPKNVNATNIGTENPNYDGLTGIFPDIPAGGYSVKVKAMNDRSSPAYLAAWIDFDGNGIFDQSEVSEVVEIPNNINSLTEFTISWPALPVITRSKLTTYLRIRLTSEEIDGTWGSGDAADGEVEDYYIRLNLLDIFNSAFSSNQNSDHAKKNDTITYEIRLTNSISGTAQIFNPIPEGTQYLESAPQGNLSEIQIEGENVQCVVWDVDDLIANDNPVFTFKVKLVDYPEDSDIIYNTAYAKMNGDTISTVPGECIIYVDRIEAINDYFATIKNSDKICNVLENDSVDECSSIIPTIEVNAENGNATVVNNYIIYTPDTDFVGIDSVKYKISCNGAEAFGQLYLLVLDPVASQYMACPQASVKLEVRSLQNVKFNWYDIDDNLLAEDSDSVIVSKDDSALQFFYVEGKYGDATFPLYPIELLLGGNCGSGGATDCALNGRLLFYDDFEGNSPDDPRVSQQPLPSGTTDYNFVTENENAPRAGVYYSLLKNNINKYGSLTISSQVWHIDFSDNTHPEDMNLGYMLLVEAGKGPVKFYEKAIGNLCEGSRLNFSANIANLGCVIPNSLGLTVDPNIKIEILDKNENVLTSYFTGKIPRTSVGQFEWGLYGFDFVVPVGIDSIKLRMTNISSVWQPNAFVMDNVEIRLCVPPVSITSPSADEIEVCPRTSFTFSGNYTDDGVFGNNLVSHWEFSETGLPDDWTKIQASESGSPNGEIISNYTITNISESNEGYYKLVVGNSETVGKYRCRSESKIIRFIVSDLSVPEIDCKNDQTRQSISGQGYYITNGDEFDVSVTNECPESFLLTHNIIQDGVSNTSLDGAKFQMGTTTVIWTATSNNPNETPVVCSFKINIIEDEICIGCEEGGISCSTIGNQVKQVDNDQTYYTHQGSGWDITAISPDGISSIEYTLSGTTTGSGTSLENVQFNLGVTTVSWTATSNNPDVDPVSCTFTVTVIEDEICIGCGENGISCSTIGDQVKQIDDGTSSYTHHGTDWNITAISPDGISEISYVLSGATIGNGLTLDGISFHIGTTTVTWTATSNNPDVDPVSCTFKVTVIEDEICIGCGDNGINCDSIGNQVKQVDNGQTYYTHQGTGWDITAISPYGISSVEYTLSGTTTGSGTSLENVQFNLGVTTVSWTATSNNPDVDPVSCTFTVTVIEDEICIGCGENGISCSTIGNQVKQIDSGQSYYTHVGTGWNVTAIATDGIQSITYRLNGATTGSGASLDNIRFHIGTTIVTWTAVSNAPSSATATCNFTVTVIEDEICIGCGDNGINCDSIGDQVKLADAGQTYYTHTGSTWDVTAVSTGGIRSIVYTLSGATTGSGASLDNVRFNLGTTKILWTATSDDDNISPVSCMFTVDVIEDSICIGCGENGISCSTIGDQVKKVDSGKTYYTHSGTDWNITAISTEGIRSINYSLNGATTGSGTSLDNIRFNIGTTIITWTVTSENSSISPASCSFTLIVIEDDICIGCGENGISCSTIGDQVRQVDNGETYYMHSGTDWNVTAISPDGIQSLTYNLSGATTGAGIDLQDVQFNVGTTTVTWTAISNAPSSATATCSFKVTVIEDEICIGCGENGVSCSTIGNQVKQIDAGQTYYTHTDNNWNITAVSPYGIRSIEYGLSGATSGNGTSLNGMKFNLGITKVTWTATSNNPDVDPVSCIFTVTVIEDEICIGCDENGISCNSIGDHVKKVDNGEIYYTHSGTAWDVTAISTGGIQSIEYRLSGATNGNGNSLDGAVFNIGTTIVTWTATSNDPDIDTVSCTFKVTVMEDDICIGCDENGISCSTIGDQIKKVNNGNTHYVHSGSDWNVTAISPDGVQSIVYNLSGATNGSGVDLNGISFNVGVTKVTWTAISNVPSSATVNCSFTVTVIEDDICIGCGENGISCSTIGNQVKQVDSGQTYYTHHDTGWDVTAISPDGVQSLEYSLSGATTGSGTSLDNINFNLGITTVTWTAMSNPPSSATATCSFTVTVIEDDICIGCGENGVSCATIGDQIKQVDSGQMYYTHTGTNWNVTATSPDGIQSLEYNLTGATTGTGTSLYGVVFHTGVTSVTWTATSNNPASTPVSCTFTVTVIEDEICIGCDPDGISCSTIGNPVKKVDAGELYYTHSDTTWNVTAISSYGIQSIVYSLSGVTTGSGTSLENVRFNIGVTKVTWTVTSNNSSSSPASCTFTVTVIEDDICIGCGENGISCTTIGNQVKQIENGTTYYTHYGTDWDITAVSPDGIQNIEYTLTGATTGTGNSLNGIRFYIGTTTITWTATSNNPLTQPASCTFIINVMEEDVCIGCGENGVSCATIGSPVKKVDIGELYYTHSDTTWNVTASSPDGIQSIVYTLSGATTGTGTSLENVRFNLGITVVTWTATSNNPSSVSASCSFKVTIVEDDICIGCDEDGISCSTIGSQIKKVNNGDTQYIHSGLNWNVTAISPDGVQSIVYNLSGATNGNGISLDGVSFNVGITTVTWTAMSNAPSSATTNCSYTVTVIEDDVCIGCGENGVSCITIGNQVKQVDAGETYYSHSGTDWNVTAISPDGIQSLTYSLSGATTGSGTSLEDINFNVGVTTVTWTAISNALSSATATCIFTVTVIEDEVCIGCGENGVSCATIGDQVKQVDSGQTYYTHTDNNWNVTAVSPDGIQSIEYRLSGATNGNGTDLNGIIFNLGITKVTWTATSLNPLSTPATCTFTVTVIEDDVCIGCDENGISCSTIGDQVKKADSGETYYTHHGNDWNVTAASPYGIQSIEYRLSGATNDNGTDLNGIIFNLGITTVTWTATSVNPSATPATCTFTVTVIEDDVCIGCDENGVSCSTIGDQVKLVDNGTNYYTHYGSDWDITAISPDGINSIKYTLSGATNGTGNNLNGVRFYTGITVVIWTATSNAPSLATETCSFTVNVIGDEVCIGCDENGISCSTIGDQIKQVDSGQTYYTHSGTDWNVTAISPDGIKSIEYRLNGATTGTGTSLYNIRFNTGVTTVTWTATSVNPSATPASCTFTVTVIEDEICIGCGENGISCGTIGDQIKQVDSGNLYYVHQGTTWDVTAISPDGIRSIKYTLRGATLGTGTSLNNMVFNLGVTTVTWTAISNAPSSAEKSCSFTVTVIEDDICIGCGENGISCSTIGDQVKQVDPGQTYYTHQGTDWNVTAMSPDGISIIEYNLSGATIGTGTNLDNIRFYEGITTVTWKAVSNNPSSTPATCSFIVTVIKDEICIGCDENGVSCSTIGNQVKRIEDGVDYYTHHGTDWDVTAVSPDGVQSIIYTLGGATTGIGYSLDNVRFNIGTTYVTWTATSNGPSAATASCTFNIIVTEDDVCIGCDENGISCATIGDQVKKVDPSKNYYTHHGTDWNVTAISSAGIRSIGYSLSGATIGTGTSLDNIRFNLGVTTVTWRAVSNNPDTNIGECTFTVTVIEDDICIGCDENGISCSTIGNQVKQISGGMGYYIHQGTNWDITAVSPDGINSIEFNLHGATVDNGTTLNGVRFNIGTTIVIWTAISNDPDVDTATCRFTVTVIEDEICIGCGENGISCSTIGDQVKQVDEGRNYYTNHGTDWNVTAVSPNGIQSIKYSLNGATIGTGTSLNNIMFNVGTTIVTWTATSIGNDPVSESCSFTVTVIEDEICIGCGENGISCTTIGNQVKKLNSGVDYYMHYGDDWDVTAVSVDGINSIEYELTGATNDNGTSLDRVRFSIGTTYVTWTATSNNPLHEPSTCTFTVTVIEDDVCIGCGEDGVSCSTIGNQVKHVDSGMQYYIHRGTDWNVNAVSPDGIRSLTYILDGATNGTGTNLDGIRFYLGTTIVKWVAVSNNTLAKPDTCSFIVTVVNEDICIGCDPDGISCSTIGDRVELVDNNENYYTHLGTGWNITAISPDGIRSIEYTLSGATTGSGTSLDNVRFNIGTTIVTWTAASNNDNIQPASCSFIVNIIEDEICIGCGENGISCTTIGDQVKKTDTGKTYYTHSGSDWNITAISTFGIQNISYTLSGASNGNGSSLNGVRFYNGTTTVTWTATSNNPDIDPVSCIFKVTVIEDEICIGCGENGVSCNSIGNQVKQIDSGSDFYTHTGTNWDITAVSPDGIQSINYILSGSTNGNGVSLDGVRFYVGTTTVTWVAVSNDPHIEPVSCSFDVVVIEDEICIGCGENGVSCNSIGNQVKRVDTGSLYYSHQGTDWNVTAISVDGIQSISYTLSGATNGTGTNLNGVRFNVGITTVTWTAVSNAPSSAITTCTFTVTVIEDDICIGCGEDGISCATIGNQVKQVNNTNRSYYIHSGADWDITAISPDGIRRIEYRLSGATNGTGSSLNGVGFFVGTTTVTWRAYSNNSSAEPAVCSFTVTVIEDDICIGCGEDGISCRSIGNQVRRIDNGSRRYTHHGTDWNVTAVSVDGINSLQYTLSGATSGNGDNLDGVEFNIGVTFITWTAVSNAPSISPATCTFTVTVIEDDICIGCGENGISCSTIGDQIKEVSDGTTYYYHQGTNWDITAVSPHGIRSIEYQLSGATNGNGVSLNGVRFYTGTTTVVWTATSENSNISPVSCTFTVNVIEDEICIGCGENGISCSTIGNQVKQVNDNGTYYLHQGSDWNITALSTDGIHTIEYVLSGVTNGVGTDLNGVRFNLGTTTVTWTATSNNINISPVSCEFTVTVIEDEICIGCGDNGISCTTIGNQVKQVDIGTGYYTHYGTDWNVTAASPDGVQGITYTLSGVTQGSGNNLDGIRFNIGITTITWTATSNNPVYTPAVCSFTLEVKDNESPCIGCDGGISCEDIGDIVRCPDYGKITYTHRGTDWNVTATDNDGISSIKYTLSGATTGTGTSLNNVSFNTGLTTVTWTATDNLGNSSECSFSVMVSELPLISIAESPEAELCLGSSVPLTIQTNGTIIRWRNRDASVASVSDLGVVKALSAGITELYCVVESENGCLDSASVIINVPSGFTIEQQPQSFNNLCPDSEITLSIVTDKEELNYQWYHDGAAIPGANSAEYNFVYNEAMAGDYYVEAGDNCTTLVSNIVKVSGSEIYIIKKWDDVLTLNIPDHQFVSLQWYKNGVAISKDGNALYYVEEGGLSGIYHIRCYYTESTYIESCPFEVSGGKSSEIYLYPNPSYPSSVVTIIIEDESLDIENAKVEIYDIMGRFVESSVLTGFKTDIISPLTEGSYILRIITKSGDVIVKNMIVNKN